MTPRNARSDPTVTEGSDHDADRASATVDGGCRPDRIALDPTSWVDRWPGWLQHSEVLFSRLLVDVAWQPSRLFRYDHWVEERRLGAMWHRGQLLPNPALAGVQRAVQRHYRVQFDGFGMIQYRDGSDGQGFHRDTDMRWLDDTLIAVLTLGAQRPWLLRPRASRHDASPGRGAVHDLAPASGDLIVMGGRCQADWEHSVPYLAGRPTGVRISLQWRYTTRRGRPFAGASSRAPLTFGRPSR